jgi:hypothetical protein
VSLHLFSASRMSGKGNGADPSVRQFVTLNLLRPFAAWLGLKKAKLFRFLERKSASFLPLT